MRRYPLRSPEARRIIEQGPPWRAPVEPPEPEEIPWHTEADVELSVARMKNWAAAGELPTKLGADLFTHEQWANLARVALGMSSR